MRIRKKYTLSFSILSACLFIVLAWLAGPSLLKTYLVVREPVDKADALVVMAGQRKQRLPTAACLYRKGVAPKILLADDGVFAGWSRKYQRNLYLVEWAKEDLLNRGVSREDIVLLEHTESGSIHDALNTRDYVLEKGDIHSLLIVTSDYHTRRTLWTFRQVFDEEPVQIYIYPAVREQENDGPGFKNLVLEFLKLAYYKLRYGLFGEQL